MVTAAIVLSAISLTLSVILPIVLSDRSLRRSFVTLEDDFENLSSFVRSSLGRVSRLKRSIMRGEIPQEEPDSANPARTGTVESGSLFPGLTAAQSAVQKRILERRKLNGGT